MKHHKSELEHMIHLQSLSKQLGAHPSLAILGAERRDEQQAQNQRDTLFGAYASDHPEPSVKTANGKLAWTRRN